LVRVKMEMYTLELQKTMCKGLVRLLAVGPDPNAQNITGWQLNSVSGLVSMIWYRIPFDRSELSHRPNRRQSDRL
jgi:hypothetical protein